MEVHPPEHPIFTWKQFFIHMSTVCLGLLLAFALDKTVEALHHNHQRHQLQEDLHAENQRNLQAIATDIADISRPATRLNALVAAARAASPDASGRFAFPADAQINMFFTTPSHQVWDTAHENQIIALLTRDFAGMYGRMYFQNDQLEITRAASAEQLDHIDSMQAGLADTADPHATLHATAEQRARLIEQIAFAQRQLRMLDIRLHWLQFELESIESGTSTEQQMLDRTQRRLLPWLTRTYPSN